jgi:cytochrome b561
MIGMPVSGYLWTTGHGYDVDFVGLIQMPRLAWNNKALGDLAKWAHVWGRWLVYGVISLHLLGVVYHVLFRADGLLGRMLPANAIEPMKEK